MKRVLIYYAHPAHSYSRINKALMQTAQAQSDVTFVDLYQEYPRYRIDIDKEQDRMREHDVILFQFPIYWYSCPSLMKEFMDVVLEHGFAYGSEDTELTGKQFGIVVSTSGSETDYSKSGYQNFPLTTFMTPFEQTANLCRMTYLPPFAYFGAHTTDDTTLTAHAKAYGTYISALRDETFDHAAAASLDMMTASNLPVKG